MGLNLEIGSEDRDKKIEDLVKYMKERKKYSYEHQLWAFKFYLCELLNFVNVIFQMCLTDKFLGYSFSEYGLDVLSWPDQDPELRMDPMSRVFPRITKCRFEKFGGSGTIQNFDALCVLGMNIINEKIFVFLWFWFIVLAIITGVNLGRGIGSIGTLILTLLKLPKMAFVYRVQYFNFLIVKWIFVVPKQIVSPNVRTIHLQVETT